MDGYVSAICINCNEEINIDLKNFTSKTKGISCDYFVCNNCREVYITTVFDNKLIQMIAIEVDIRKIKEYSRELKDKYCDVLMKEINDMIKKSFPRIPFDMYYTIIIGRVKRGSHYTISLLICAYIIRAVYMPYIIHIYSYII